MFQDDTILDISSRKMELGPTNTGHIFKMPNFPPTCSNPIKHVSCIGAGHIMLSKHQANDEVESPFKLQNFSNPSDAPLNSLMDSIVSPKGENSGRIRSWAILFGL
jgi:hypothetical protein